MCLVHKIRQNMPLKSQIGAQNKAIGLNRFQDTLRALFDNYVTSLVDLSAKLFGAPDPSYSVSQSLPLSN
jgi:hypothetical protein